jgi:hypothetical protein
MTKQKKDNITFKFKKHTFKMHFKTFSIKLFSGHNWKRFQYYSCDKLKSFYDSKGNYILLHYYNNGQLKQVNTNIQCESDYLIDQIEAFNKKDLEYNLIF